MTSKPPALRIPTLDGARVRLAPLAMSHSRGLYDLWRDPAVCEHSGPAVDALGEPIALPAQSTADSDRLLEFWLQRARCGSGFRWAVSLASDDSFVGAVGFNALGPVAEYAYHFIPRHWGSGLAAEASRLALTWAFDSGSPAVEVFIEAANIRSLALARRLGFRQSKDSSGPTPCFRLARPARDLGGPDPERLR